MDAVPTSNSGVGNWDAICAVWEHVDRADHPSLLLLEFLVRQMADSPLMLLGCYRDAELSRQHLLSDTLGHLSREPLFLRQPLSGLSHEDMGRFIEAATGQTASPGLVDAVFDHTEGNPFFTSEVVRLLFECGELGGTREGTNQETREIRIPEGVLEVIGQRLNRLSQLCNDTLTTASVIGREFDFKLLGLLAEERPDLTCGQQEIHRRKS